MITVYKITNRLNRKPYVGQTKQPIERRFMQHAKADSPLGNAMRNCGLDNFTIEIIEECETQEQVNERERFWIKVLNCKIPNGYNRSSGGEGHEYVKPPLKNLTVMKLGEIIREYRQRNKMSMGDFAKASGISKPYISMLEANKNSNGGKPIAPSVETLQKVACVLGISLDKLLRKLGDEEIDLRPSPCSDDEIKLLHGYRALPDESKQLFRGLLFQLSKTPPSSTVDKRGVVQNNTYGNNYSGITGGNFNSRVTAV